MTEPARIAQQPLAGKPEVQRTVRKARPWIERLGRYGFGVRGIVYILIAILAAMQATGYRHGEPVSGRSALLIIASQRFGTVMLIAAALGFFGFGLWQLFSGLFLPMTRRRSFLRMVGKRISRVGSGIMQIILCVGAIGLIIGAHRTSGDAAARGWTAWLMSHMFGIVIVLGIGIGVAIFGFIQIYKGWQKKFPQQLDSSELKGRLHAFVMHFGRFGLISRGIVFCIVGFFLIIAALRQNPNEARGLGGAMRALEMQPYGPWLLGAVSIGLLGYGLYLVIGARYCTFRLD